MRTGRFTKLSRRQTLQWVAATSLASALPRWSSARAVAKVPASARVVGYGSDPDLKNPAIPWPLIMTGAQLKATALLADAILPGSATAPAPSAVGVADFVNEWVSAPYPDQVRDRVILFKGIEWLDAESQRRGQRGFVHASNPIRTSIVEDLALGSSLSEFATQRAFFQRVRFLVVGAYYTTSDGWKDIGYVGNVPLGSYPPVTQEERAILDRALSRLGLL